MGKQEIEKSGLVKRVLATPNGVKYVIFSYSTLSELQQSYILPRLKIGAIHIQPFQGFTQYSHYFTKNI